MVFPLAGGAGIPLFGPTGARPPKWTSDGKFLFLSPSSPSNSGMVGRSYVIPLPPGRPWPDIPEGGFRALADVETLSGVRVIDAPDVAPGPTPEVYAFSRETIQRNLYRIPVP
jgi:hypothetical protein